MRMLKSNITDKKEAQLLKDLVLQNRTCRRFYQEVPVELETLRELVDLARLSPSASNMQPLKYIISCDPEKNAVIFSQLGWAGQFKDWPGPSEGERPSAYIIMLLDTELSKNVICDQGIAAQTIMLGARDRGLGGCMIGSIKHQKLRELLSIPDQYEILLVLAIGKPAETVVIEPMPSDGNVNYWRDEESVHHVPKRSLEEIILDLG